MRWWGPLLFAGMIGVAAADDGLFAEGRRLYMEGRRADGSALLARRDGDGRLQGRDMACVQCHRRSGAGTVEGVVIVPSIQGRVLFNPGSPPPGHLPRRAAGMALQDYGFRTRPAYDDISLARALREGIGAGGARFDGLMPRYDLSSRDIAALTAYLHSLDATPADGIDPQPGGAIRLATVILPDADPSQSAAMRAVLSTCVAERSPRPGSGRRPWTLDEWALSGPPETWRGQLEAFRMERPVFALLGGIGRDWAHVHAFCEANALPCLFPNTDAPGEQPPPHASMYLSPGVGVEAGVIAADLDESGDMPERLVQVFQRRDIGRYGAAALASALPGIPNRAVSTGADPGWIRASEVLVLWLAPTDLASFFIAVPEPPDGVRVYLSASLAGFDTGVDTSLIPPPWRPAVRVVYPFDLPDLRLGRQVFNLGGWMAGHGLALVRSTARVQGDSFSACEVVARALYTLPEHPTREVLLERVEEAYAGAVATAYPRFTLGPGQRFGSKGAYLLKIMPDGKWQPQGAWRVP